MNDIEDIVRYALSSMKKATTFRLSRTLLILDMEWEKKHGNQRTSLHYGLFPPAFYVEEFPAMLLNMPDTEKINENGLDKGFFVYRGVVLEIDGETREILDRIISETEGMDDHSLNKRVVNSEEYRRALEKKE